MPENKKTGFVEFLSSVFLSQKAHEKRMSELYKTIALNNEGRGDGDAVRKNSLSHIIDKYLPSARSGDFDHDDNAHKSWQFAVNREAGEVTNDRRIIKKYLFKHISSDDLIHGHIFPRYSSNKNSKDFGKLKWRLKHLVLEPIAAFSILVVVSALLTLAYPGTAKKLTDRVDKILFFPLAKSLPDENLTAPRLATKEHLAGFITANSFKLKKAFDRKQDNFLITQDDIFGRVAGARENTTDTKIENLSKNVAKDKPSAMLTGFVDSFIKKEEQVARALIKLIE